MLVLSRKRLEGIRIGDDIRITVVKIDRSGVRLGIEAPRGITIVRDELLHEAAGATAEPCGWREGLAFTRAMA